MPTPMQVSYEILPEHIGGVVRTGTFRPPGEEKEIDVRALIGEALSFGRKKGWKLDSFLIREVDDEGKAVEGDAWFFDTSGKAQYVTLRYEKDKGKITTTKGELPPAEPEPLPRLGRKGTEELRERWEEEQWEARREREEEEEEEEEEGWEELHKFLRKCWKRQI